MKNVQKIIDLFGGQAFQHVKIVLDSPAMMPLCIERIGNFGPNDLPCFSVAHYYEQSGDLMADPEMTFVVSADGAWHPVSFRNDGVGCYQEGAAGAMFQNESGRWLIRPRLIRELKAFARIWNTNIRDHGYVDAARCMAARNQEVTT